MIEPLVEVDSRWLLYTQHTCNNWDVNAIGGVVENGEVLEVLVGGSCS